MTFSKRIEATIVAVICSDIATQAATAIGAMDPAGPFATYTGTTIWCIYVVEFVMRIRHADDWGRYAFSFFGIVDMLAIIPVWMISGVDLSAIRAIRLSRLLVTMTKLITRPHAAARLAMAFRTARDEAGVLFAWAGLATGISGVSMYFLERDAQPEVFGSVTRWRLVGGDHPHDGRVTATTTR